MAMNKRRWWSEETTLVSIQTRCSSTYGQAIDPPTIVVAGRALSASLGRASCCCLLRGTDYWWWLPRVSSKMSILNYCESCQDRSIRFCMWMQRASDNKGHKSKAGVILSLWLQLKGSVTGETKPLLFTEASILRIACLQEEETKEKMLLHQIAIIVCIGVCMEEQQEKSGTSLFDQSSL